MGGVASLMLLVLLPAESHSMMVRIFRSHGAGGRWRCVRRAFFRWWKSPSVRVYLRNGRRDGWFQPEDAAYRSCQHVIEADPSVKGSVILAIERYLRTLSLWVVFSFSYSADSLKETLRPV